MNNKLALLGRIQVELSNRPALANLKARALLSLNGQNVIIHFQHPVTGQAGSFDAGSVADIQDNEHLRTERLCARLAGRGIDKPFRDVDADGLVGASQAGPAPQLRLAPLYHGLAGQGIGRGETAPRHPQVKNRIKQT